MDHDEKRLAIFLTSLAGGGAERAMVLLANGFVQRGFRVDLVLTQARGPYLADVHPEVRVVDLGARRILSSLPGLVRYLRRERPPVLLPSLSTTNCIALWARALARVRTRVVVNEQITPTQAGAHTRLKRMRLLPTLMRWAYPRADGLTAISRGVANDVARVTGVGNDQIHVVYNPAVTTRLEKLAKEPLGHAWFCAGAPPVVLAAGRLVPQKDFAVLLRAFARLRGETEARLVVLGEGEERRHLEDLSRELGIQGDVDLPGFDENPYRYMARSAVFALSSRWEGLGMVLIEAMACGTPVVSTDCPNGPREILEDGRWGRLVPVGDDEALADALASTLEDSGPDPRRRAAFFSVERAVDGYLSVLFPEDACRG